MHKRETKLDCEYYNFILFDEIKSKTNNDYHNIYT